MMFFAKSSTKRFISTLAVAGVLLTGVQGISLAQSTSGLTLFSGVKRENILSYYLDYGGQVGGWDRYRLRIPAKKLSRGVVKFIISYSPENNDYDGIFDKKEMQVRVNNKPLPLKTVNFDEDKRIIELELEKPLENGKSVEIVLSNVKNPSSDLTSYFNCQIVSITGIPEPVYIGTWIMSIGR